jgi:pyruvate-formate lyase-activating enzyme
VYDSHSIKKLRRLIIDNKVHPGCVGCREKEKRIGYCKRNSLIKGVNVYKLLEKEIDMNYLKDNMVWLDVRMSNACNLKCRHCYSVLSTSWGKDAKLLEETETGKLYTNRCMEYTTREKRELPPEIIVDIANSVGKLRRIEFKGGEPLLRQDMIEQFITNMDCNLNKLQIDIVTNGSIKFSDRLIKLLNQCGRLKLDFSVEAGEDVFKYIRGISLKDIEENIKSCDQTIKPVSIGFRITQMAYNIFEFPKVYTWIKSLNLKNGIPIFIHNYVVKPEFLNVLVLPIEVRMEAQKHLMNLIELHPDCDESVRKLYETLGKPQNDQYFDLFKSFTKNLDEIRGTSFSEVEPRIGAYL